MTFTITPHDEMKKIEDFFDVENKYWRTVYTESDQVTGFLSYEMKKRRYLIDKLFMSITGTDHLKVLDCGCGTGVIMGDVMSLGHMVVGIDLSMEQLKSAKEHHPTVESKHDERTGTAHLIQGNMMHLPFPDNTFDIVYAVGVIPYLESDPPLIKEMSRVVKHGGYVLITLPGYLKINVLMDPYYYVTHAAAFVMRKLHSLIDRKKANNRQIYSQNTLPYRLYKHGQLNNLYKENNLEIINSISVSFGAITLWKRKLLPERISMKLSDILQKCSAHFWPLNYIANRWIILLRKLES